MSSVTKALMEFDEEDVRRLDEALAKFWELRGSRGYPDYSPGANLYASVLSLVLLRSQLKVERFTLAISSLTVMLVILTAVLLIRDG